MKRNAMQWAMMGFALAMVLVMIPMVQVRGQDDVRRDRARAAEARHDVDVEAFEREIVQLRQRVKELAQAGRAEEAERLEVEIKQRLERFRQHRQAAAGERDRPHGQQHAEELEQRVHHLRQAAEHLAAAGEVRMSRDVAEHAERLQREVHERHGGEVEQQLKQMAEAIHQMQNQIKDLSLVVQELRLQADRR